MKPSTEATLEQLSNVDWFTNVGTFRGIEDRSKISLVPSWRKAIDHCSSVAWENLCLEAANQYRERLVERSPERFCQWNDIVASLKPAVQPFVQRKIEEVVREHDLPSVFEDTVQWDILHVCMEAEYVDVCQPGFYASQAYWYTKGHFPCGWDGDFPAGVLVVY